MRFVIILILVAYTLMGWFLCNISPDTQYVWYHGIWHGLFFPVNFVRSWFTDVLFWANLHTTAYGVFHCIFSFLGITNVLSGVYAFIED